MRLKYGVVVECTGCEKDADGRVTAVLARVVPDTKSGTPGADAVKVKGTITWVGVHDAVPATVRLYDRLFTEAQPDAGGRDFREVLNPHSKQVVHGLPRAVAGRRGAPSSTSSSSATATSSPTASTTRRAGRCSTASPRCATAGRAETGLQRAPLRRTGRWRAPGRGITLASP